MTALPPLADTDHVAGPASAAVTLVHYGDFECPYSKDVHDIVREVRQAFGSQVRYVFRHFPLRPHPHALGAALAAEAAARQGGFWPLHDRLYANPLALRPDQLAAHADALGLDGRAVRDAVETGTGRDAVLAQKRAGVRAGVGSTLNLWIDGALFEEEAIEAALITHVIEPLQAASG